MRSGNHVGYVKIDHSARAIRKAANCASTPHTYIVKISMATSELLIGKAISPPFPQVCCKDNIATTVGMIQDMKACA